MSIHTITKTTIILQRCKKLLWCCKFKVVFAYFQPIGIMHKKFSSLVQNFHLEEAGRQWKAVVT